MIVSFVPGRIRLRFKELKNSAAAELVKTRIQAVPGINKAEANPLTGSILIEYDAKILPLEKLAAEGEKELAQFGIKLDVSMLKSVNAVSYC